jgi:hypothetical protein
MSLVENYDTQVERERERDRGKCSQDLHERYLLPTHII